jgi:hypothetical protein
VKRYRVGRKLGRTIYLQVSGEAGEDDVLLGMLDDAEVAKAVVDVLNAAEELAAQTGGPT